jgi:integrase
MLWVVRAVNRGKLHTQKYHRSNRPIRLTEADVERLLAVKARMNATGNDWMFPNSIKKPGKKMKPGPFRHEDFLGRVIQPVADGLGLPHITWRLLRHWGATQMVEARVRLKAAQERLGHSRPDILLSFYAHVLDASADMAAATISGSWEADFRRPLPLTELISLGLSANWLPYWLPRQKALLN